MRRMCLLATQSGAADVWGGIMSPVSDAYGKAGLAPWQQRVAMCEAAAAGHPHVVCDAWEACQPEYTRTLVVLRHIQVCCGLAGACYNIAMHCSIG